MKRTILFAVLGLAACGGGPDVTTQHDLSTAHHDLAMSPEDLAGVDGATDDLAVPDMAMANPDLAPEDLRPAPPDLTPPPDLASTSGQIQAVRDAADAAPDAGTNSVSLPITNAFVTYTKPLIGADEAGFFLQADPTGPALFVAVDPTTLTPVPQPGDRVSLTVTGVSREALLRVATAITNYTQVSTGGSVTGLIQDVSAAADLVTAVDNYESELVKLNGAVTADFTSSGTGFVQAPITTTGLPTGSTKLRLRLPTTVRDNFDLNTGCTFSLTGSPLWRFSTTAQPSAWQIADLATPTCPAPKVASASGTAATTVVVNFDRVIAPASFLTDGTQFTINNGINVSASALAGKQVTLTTDAQTPLAMYTVTAAPTLTDVLGTPVSATTNNSANFLGFSSAAVLRINEVSPNVGGNADLIELYVVTGGNTNGLTIVQDVVTPTVVATLPAIAVATGDFIVVHQNAVAGVTGETTSKTSCASTTVCYVGAWDVIGGTTGLTFSDRVLSVKTPGGVVQDAVAFDRTTLATAPAAFPGDLQSIQASGYWLPKDCGGNLCTYTSTPTALAVSADWTTAGNSATGNTIARKGNMDSDQNSDWAVGASSLGKTNP